jgi:hypothetical protein
MPEASHTWQETMEAIQEKMQDNQENMDAIQENIEAMVEAIQDKVSLRWMSASQEVMEAIQEQMEAMIKTGQEQMRAKVKASLEEMKAGHENMEAARNSIWSKLDKTIKNRVEDILSCVDQQTQGLYEVLNVKIEELQLGLQMSLDMWTGRLCEEIADTKSSTSGSEEHRLR